MQEAKTLTITRSKAEVPSISPPFTYYLEIPRSKPAREKKYFQFIIVCLKNRTLLNLSITEVYARSVIFFAHAPL